MRELLTRNHFRLLLWAGIVFTLIIIPFSLFLSNQFSKYAHSQMDLFHRDKVVHTASQTEFILNKLKSYGLNMYEDRTIQGWLQRERPDPLADMEVLNTLTTFMSTEPFIRRAYLMNLRTRQAFDSQTGVTSFEAFQDQVMLKRVQEQQSLFLQFQPHEAQGDAHLSLVVPSTPAKRDIRGYLVLLLDNRALQTHLLAHNEELGTNLIVLDEEGRNVLGGEGSGESIAALLSGARTDGAAPSVVEFDTGRRLFVNSAAIPSQKWTVHSLTEMRSFRSQADSFQRRIVMYSLLLLVLLLTAAMWNSRRAVRPFRHLAEQLQRKFNADAGHSSAPPVVRDEYSMLKYGIEKLSNQVDEMNVSLRDRQGIVKAEYLRQWVLQGRLGRAVRGEIAEATDLFAKEKLRLAVIKIESYHAFAERYDFESRRLFTYALCNIAEEVVRGEGGAFEAVDFAGDHIVLLIGLDRDESDMMAILETAKKHVRQYIRVNIVVAVSDAKDIDDDLRAVYDFVLELTLLKFINGSDRIYTEGDYERYVHMMDPVVERKGVEKLLASVKAGNGEQVVESLDELFGQLAAMKFSECKVQLTVLLFSVVKEFEKLSALQGVDGIEKQLAGFPTLQDLRRWLEQELMEIMERLNSRQGSDRKGKLAEEMAAYIAYRIHDPMLSADDVAEHVSLSAKYVRQIFMETHNQSLSAYMLDLRVNKVKELLVTTALSVSDIGERSGFLTKSHFFTAFKKATGVTPNQYRQQHST
ncbi:AraC family transcriptional regulator [Paenibacillus antri]|nr:response regulator transcription factor [Paenibacillus antri]